MSETRNLPWGEKHLCGDFFTIKITLGYNLYSNIGDKLKTLGLTVMQVNPSKKWKLPKYMAYGVLNQDNFQKYLNVKNEAQAKFMIDKAANLLDSVRIRKEQIKYRETIEGVRIVEPITLD